MKNDFVTIKVLRETVGELNFISGATGKPQYEIVSDLAKKKKASVVRSHLRQIRNIKK